MGMSTEMLFYLWPVRWVTAYLLINIVIYPIGFGLAELVLGWELVKYGSSRIRHDLFYWENVGEGTTSEVDYIVAHQMKVLPIECKAGTSGKMKSLRLFMCWFGELGGVH